MKTLHPAGVPFGVKEKLLALKDDVPYFYALQIAPSRVGEMYRLIDWAALHGHFRLGVNPWLSLDSPIQVSRYRSHEQRAPYTTGGETRAMVPHVLALRTQGRPRHRLWALK
jgi:hypothetical protein